MKTIKGFEGEEIAVSGFGEWVGKDYIDYKFEYKNNQKVIKELFKENQELKKQLENCYCNRTDCSARIKDSKQYDSLVQKVENKQKAFMKLLENKIDTLTQGKETFADLDKGDAVVLMELAMVLEEYKEIIGDKE